MGEATETFQNCQLQNFHGIFENHFDILLVHEFLEIEMEKKASVPADWKRREKLVSRIFFVDCHLKHLKSSIAIFIRSLKIIETILTYILPFHEFFKCKEGRLEDGKSLNYFVDFT